MFSPVSSPLVDYGKLSPFLFPRGIAVIGVSQDPNKLGYGLARNLVQSNYPGGIYFVNPKEGSLFGRTFYLDIGGVPDPLDLAILLIPAARVPQALEKCGERGLRAAIIVSGGFRETSPAGAALEARCLQIAGAFGMRIMGPNCIGLIDTHLPLDATFFSPPGPLPGDVAFISHSGAICAAVIDWARGQGFGLSRMVSLGNQADINESDVLEPVAADHYTRVLTMYLEGVSNGREFTRAARSVTRHKPVIALKVGRFASGRRAVASHTGALAGQESAFNAAFRSAGVFRAETSEEMFDWARALAWCPPLQGRDVAVLTNAGGPGVTAADALESNGLHLAPLQENTQAALRQVLPPAASLHNPVDMLAAASPEQYAACLRILLADPGVCGILVILPPPPMYTAGTVAKALIPIITQSVKPVVIALMGERLIQEALEHFRAAHIPEYRFPERAASALAVLAQRAEYLARCSAQPDSTESNGLNKLHSEAFHPETVRRILENQAANESLKKSKSTPDISEGALLQDSLHHILKAYGIPSPWLGLAHSAQQAVQMADEVGYPVALKIASPDLPHKSDIGGVLLNLATTEAVFKGFGAMLSRVKAASPQARIQGIYIQGMAPPGQEVILGAVQDPQFGPLIMFGSGGVEVEAMKDVAFALAPLSWAEAEYLLENTWAGRRLSGYRSLPPADREAVLDTLIRLARLAADFPEIAELEINPLRVLPDGQGVFAVDVRGRLQVVRE